MKAALALLLLLGLAACSGLNGLGGSAGGVYAPGPSRERADVDGLIVGHRLMAAGEFELALRAYSRAAVERGLNVDTLSAMGSANLRLGRLGQAETLLRRAVAEDAGFAPAWNNLGVVLMETGRTGEAAESFRRAFALVDGGDERIADNLRRALAKRDAAAYDAPEGTEEFLLVRRGSSEYRILSAL
ncbi:tetratricopeptide repeat protein [Limimaricola pyoseonensis]|uniref:Tetratricopeptide repeat-containing protein n=1 Tax=Limimaricola pyoseonensis TaxID=521013 RepID=A0A1G7DCN0_9RHOB|nr:tetratricopeptide repeat protein [Limimaricola pyoseonensis]SDE48730.1 Tetratricopeptide repeat-containing protein [Limimaricola pyoseonensis]